MVVDTSILISILLAEPGFEKLVFKLADEDGYVKLSAVSYMEASMVLIGRRGDGALPELGRHDCESKHCDSSGHRD